jgi:uncharacterized delta-60 repeat protein/uncharacterized repeat protein (TIGR01451 family)
MGLDTRSPSGAKSVVKISMQSFCTKASQRGWRLVPWIGVLALAGLATTVAWAQPANDNFASAEVISGVYGSVSNDTATATAEPFEPNHAGFPANATIWYAWTAPQDGEVQLDTLSTPTDTVLAVYTGGGLSTLRQVAANDDLLPLQTTSIGGAILGPSVLRFNARAGTLYYFAIGAKTVGGPVVLGWAYHSAGVFRFATEDSVTTISGPPFRLVTTPIFKVSEYESFPLEDSSTSQTYYDFAVPGLLVTVTRLAGSSGRMLVDYATEDVTNTLRGDMPAVAGQDYFPVSGTLVFDDYEMTKRFVIQVSPSFNPVTFSPVETNRNFGVVLSNARPDPGESPDVSPPRLDGTYSRALVRIVDMDLDPVFQRNFQPDPLDTNTPPTLPPIFQPTNSIFNFSRAAFRTPEDVNAYWGNVIIWVDRYGTNRAGETVHYRINNTLGGGDTADPAELDNNIFPLQPGSDYATPSPADNTNGVSPSGIHGTDPDFVVEGVGANNYNFPGGGTLSWGQDDFLSKPIRLIVTNDILTEFNEDFHIYLYQTVDNATRLPGMLSETAVTILFDDQDAPAGALDQLHNPDFGASLAPPIATTPPNMAHPGADSIVYGLTVQADNKTVIVGDFVNYNSTSRGRIARMNVNGSLDTSFNPGSGANGFIGAIAPTPSGQFIIGGGFGSYNGTQRVRVARINANGSLDNSFNPGLGADGNIWAVAVQTDGKVIIGGDFNTVGGLARAHVARLNTDGSVDVSFDPGATGPNATVWALALQSDGKLVIGGEFTTVGGQTRGGIARLNDDGSLDNSFNPGAGTDGFVYALALQADGKVLVGGQFGLLDFNSRSGLARLNGNGSLDATFDPGSSGTSGTVYSILPTSAGIYVGGAFDSFNGTHRRSLVRLYANGMVDTTFLDTAYNQFAGLHRARFSDAIGIIYSLGVQTDGNVMIAGSFDKVGGGQADLQVRPDTADPNLWTEKKARDGVRNRSNVARLIGGATPGPGNINFTALSHTAQENQSSLSISLTRNNGTLGFLSANFQVEDGLAQSGVDYVYNAVPPIYLTSWELTFPSSEPGATTRMRSDGLWADNFIPTDIYGRNWFNYTPGVLVVTINNDVLTQGDRNTTFRLSNPTAADQFFLGGENIPLGAALGFSQAPFSIFDDDQQNGVVGFASVNFVVNENVTNAVVTVTRTNGTYGTVSVQYATVTGGSAVAGSDYTTRSGTLTFANGQTNRTFTIPITDDSNVEPDKTINVRLSGVTGGATIGLTNAVVTIVDNDTPGGKLNFTSATFSTNESAGAAIISVARSGSSIGTLTVYVSATNGTATAGSDFTGVTNVLNWSSGDVTPKTFVVPLLDDVLVEANETVTLRLYTPTLNSVTNLASLGAITNATLSIVNDDLRGTVAYSTASYTANEKGGPAIITVVRPGGSSESIAVNFSAFAGSAVNGIDFLATNGTLSFGPGEVSKSFTVPILNNSFPDLPRFISLSLSNATPSGTLGSPIAALINIVDDESVNEPPGGVDTVFNPSGMNAAVLALALQGDGKLIAGGEFTVANQVPAVRLVRLNGLNGTVDNTFQSAANAAVQSLALQTDGRALVGGAFTTINGVVRNHIARVMSNGALDTSFNPGAGTDNPVFAMAETFIGGDRKIFLGGNFATFNSAVRNGIARVNGDGSLDANFNPGSGVGGVVYAVAAYPTNSTHAGKVIIGGDFALYNGVGRSGVARLNADGSLDLTFDPGTGAAGAVRALAIQTDGRVLVGGSFTNFNGSALSRLARLNDSGSVDATFNAGPGADDTVLTITVQADTKIVVGGLFTHCNGVSRNRITRLNNDGTADPTINFGSGANDFVAATLVQPDSRIVLGGGFTDYDGAPRQRIARIYGGSIAGSGTLEFSSANYEVSELETNAVITIRRRGGTAGPTPGGSLSVNAATSDGTATNGVHYLGGTNVLVFPESEVFQTFSVPVIANFEVNDDRTVNLALSNIQPPGSATIGNQPTATLTIINDDSAVSFGSPTYSRIENAVDGQATITIVRSGSTTGAASVNFTTTTNGTATAGLDFTHVTNLVSFAVGETIKTVTIPIINDALIEGNETVTMELTNANGAFLLVPNTATLTIVDDDLGPGRIMFATTNTPAGESSGNAVVNLVRTNGSSGVVSVRIQTSDITASAGLDYTAQNNVSVTFGDGETNKSVLIPILDDSFVEGDESFAVTLTNLTGGLTLFGTNSGTVTIVDNDVGFSFSSPIYVVNESGPTVTISVLRLGGSNGVASVRYDTTNVTATAGSDFAGVSNGLLTFLNGEVLKTFTVSITDDSLVEGDEAFGVRLSNPTPGVQLLISSASVSILDNDTGFTLGTNSYAIDEAGTNLIVTVFRTNANTGPVSVSLTSSNLTATAGADYTAVGGALNFTNGEAVKQILVPIVNDTLVEGNETFELSLSGPSGGAQLVGITSATATIIDNDAGLRFSSSSYAVNETGVEATITVLRESILTNTVAVNYSTSDGSATNGADYVSASGLLVFTNGETSKSFSIQIIDDTLEEGPESILLSLSSPTGQVSIVNPGAAVLTIVDNDGGSILPAGSLLTVENGVVNGAIDPGETVTLLIALRNASGVNTTNLVATLLATNGVVAPSGVQNYGALIDGGASVSRPFTFTANGTNGGTVTATFQVQEQAGPSYGRATFTYLLGTSSAVYSNPAPITILDLTNASPYPSSITVTGLVGTVTKVVATVTNLYHQSPDDIDMLLAGPTGASTMLMSDAGGGNFITNVTLTFDDAAAGFLPDSSQIASGTNKPTNFLLADLLPSPAPPSPWGSTLASFNGTDPNGLWSLYIVDDLAIMSGAITRGWSLVLTTLGTVPSATDLSVKMSAAPNPVVVGSNLIFSVNVTNHGPWAATAVALTNTIPAGATFVSAAPSVGTISTNSGKVVWTIGSLAKDAGASASIVMSPGIMGTVVSTSSVLGAQGDPNPGNNTASTTNTVVAPAADLVLDVVDAPDPVYISSNNNVVYTITVNNAGPATATGVSVTNTLPSEVSFLSATPAGYTVVGRVVTFTNLGNLGSGAQLVATISARAVTPATLTNTTTCGSATTDPLKGNNTISVKTVVEFPSFGFTKVGNNLVIAWPAGATAYTLERATSLTPPITWTEVTTPPALIVGDQKVITLPIGSGNEFFRLRAVSP